MSTIKTVFSLLAPSKTAKCAHCRKPWPKGALWPGRGGSICPTCKSSFEQIEDMI